MYSLYKILIIVTFCVVIVTFMHFKQTTAYTPNSYISSVHECCEWEFFFERISQCIESSRDI